MKATKKTQYALRAMIMLAREDGVCSLKNISKEESISFDYLEKIFSKMEKAKLVNSKRGAGGGYYLSRLPGKITLKNVFDAVEESISVVDCVDKGCSRDKSCRASGAWKEVNEKLEKALSSVKLSDLI